MSKLIQQLKIDEGFRSHTYTDTKGYLTIGYGYNLEANPFNLTVECLNRYKQAGITELEAEKLLVACVTKTNIECNNKFHAWWSNLTRARQDVLVNMCFNLGMGKLLGFKNMLANCASGDFEKAAAEGLDSLWARQVHNRATRLMNQLKVG